MGLHLRGHGSHRWAPWSWEASSLLVITPGPSWWNQPGKGTPPPTPANLCPTGPCCLLGPAMGTDPIPEPRLTEVSLQPLVTLNKLVNERKIMGVGLVRHHPASCHNLQLPVSHQPGVRDSHSAWGRDALPVPLTRSARTCACWPHRAHSPHPAQPKPRTHRTTEHPPLRTIQPPCCPGPASLWTSICASWGQALGSFFFGHTASCDSDFS